MKEVARIGGEAKIIKDGDFLFIPTAPVRGFEKMVEGKSPIFVIEAVMRICGICHAAHAIAACEAFEHAFGIYPPRNGLLMREAIGLLNRIQSHLLHNIMILPDLTKNTDDALNLTLETLERINKIIADLAGAPTHPNKLVIGGIAKDINEKILDRNIEWLKEAEKIFNELREMEINWLRKGEETQQKYMATHLFYGDRYAIDLDKIKIQPYEKSSAMIAMYGNDFVEVGPRARLKIYRNFSFGGIYGLQMARIEEIKLAFLRIKEIFEEIDVEEPLRTEGFFFRKGKGIGVYEAPRGTLIHKVVVNEEGRVEEYKIIVPTMFNIPLMNKTGDELGVRMYDPCIPCATHEMIK